MAIDRVHDSTVHLLTNDWLRFQITKSEISEWTHSYGFSRTEADVYILGAQRKRELRRIRQIFIPDLIMRLHSLLVSHYQAFPIFLQKALDLTKTVASEDYGVYAEFLGLENDTARLVMYLEKVREATLISMEMSGGHS